MFASLRAVLRVNNSLSGRVCCFFLASRVGISVWVLVKPGGEREREQEIAW